MAPFSVWKFIITFVTKGDNPRKAYEFYSETIADLFAQFIGE